MSSYIEIMVLVLLSCMTLIVVMGDDKSFEEFLKYVKDFREVARKEWEKTNGC